MARGEIRAAFMHYVTQVAKLLGSRVPPPYEEGTGPWRRFSVFPVRHDGREFWIRLGTDATGQTHAYSVTLGRSAVLVREVDGQKPWPPAPALAATLRTLLRGAPLAKSTRRVATGLVGQGLGPLHEALAALTAKLE